MLRLRATLSVALANPHGLECDQRSREHRSDDTPLAPIDPVAPAQRSPQAAAKAGSARTADGQVAHSLKDLLTGLGTLCRNTIRIGASRYTFTRLTTPTELQANAFALAGVNPGK